MEFQHIYKSIDSQRSIFYAWFEAMHTRIDMALCALAEPAALTLTTEIEREIRRIEHFSNRFNPSAELSIINRTAAQKAVSISDELYTIIADCIAYHRRTFGAFDITVQSKNNYRSGIQGIRLCPAAKTILFDNSNIQLDLCGYIKGYALDRIRAILARHTCSDALISLGNSSILALGNHPNGDGWKISHPAHPHSSITLHNECLTSSGNAASHFHIINPHTGQCTASTDIQSVITLRGDVGEVLSTAFCACHGAEQRDMISKEFRNEFKEGE